MVSELNDVMYEDWLKEMGSSTIQDRRERGDLITLWRQDTINHAQILYNLILSQCRASADVGDHGLPHLSPYLLSLAIFV